MRFWCKSKRVPTAESLAKLEPTETAVAKDPEAEEQRLKEVLGQIAEISKTAHALWFALLGLLGYCFITLLAFKDKDFFACDAHTQLPILNIGIPTTYFFAFAPFLIAASYIHLHLYLHRLWHLLDKGDLPVPKPGDRPISERVYPWLITYAALMVRKETADPHQDFRWPTLWLSRIFLWTSSPFLLLMFWWWSMPAHRPALTLWIGLMLTASVWILIVAGWISRGNLIGRTWKFWETEFRLLAPLSLLAAAAIIFFVSWARTDGWMDAEEFDKFYASQHTDSTSGFIGRRCLQSFHRAGHWLNQYSGWPFLAVIDVYYRLAQAVNEQKMTLPRCVQD